MRTNHFFTYHFNKLWPLSLKTHYFEKQRDFSGNRNTRRLFPNKDSPYQKGRVDKLCIQYGLLTVIATL